MLLMLQTYDTTPKGLDVLTALGGVGALRDATNATSAPRSAPFNTAPRLASSHAAPFTDGRVHPSRQVGELRLHFVHATPSGNIDRLIGKDHIDGIICLTVIHRKVQIESDHRTV